MTMVDLEIIVRRELTERAPEEEENVFRSKFHNTWMAQRQFAVHPGPPTPAQIRGLKRGRASAESTVASRSLKKLAMMELEPWLDNWDLSNEPEGHLPRMKSFHVPPSLNQE